MIAKKNPKVDLEKKRFAFFQIGLIVAGALTLAIFEYSTIKMEKIEMARIEKPTNVIDDPTYEPVYVAKPIQQKQPKISRIDEGVKGVDKKISDEKKGQVVNKQIDVSDLLKDIDFGDNSVNGIVNPTDIPWVVDKMPQFPGGEEAMMKWVISHIDLPRYAESLNGTVLVNFVINESGEVTNVELAKGFHTDYNQAAIAAIQQMPNWTPGEQAGKPVKVRYNIPIRFVEH